MINYQLLLNKTIADIQKKETTPSLLLHACCAPCSSYVLEYLSEYFNITVFYYNPNITDEAEYKKRVLEEQRLISEMPVKNPVSFLEGRYDPKRFFEMAKGLEEVREGGERCFKCYRLRIAETAETAREKGFDFFTTTLSISPLKNAQKLNEIGGEEAERVGIPYLFSDFKKREGYKRSIQLSAQYGLYRQNYCGCIYSKMESEERRCTE